MTAYRIGRLLQLAGLVILPLSIAGEMAGRLTLGQSVLGGLIGLAVFMLGTRLLPDPAS